MTTLDEIKSRLLRNPVLAESEIYRVKFASEPEELDEVFKLRYRVFTLEQGRNPGAEKLATDIDPFDKCCIHLIVQKIPEGTVEGTYRVHFGTVALTSGLGFYSETEYDIRGLDLIAEESIEMGRSCVAREARDGTAMAMLWKGVSELLRRCGRRWLIGCVSLEDVSPLAAWGLYRHFKETGKVSDRIFAVPKEAFRTEKPEENAIAAFASNRADVIRALPPLFKGYLRMGAVICGEPAFDRDFGSIDFFIALDVLGLPERYRRHFDVQIKQEQSGV